MTLDLAHCSRAIVFLIATFSFLFIPPMIPGARLYYFAPFLITLYYQSKEITSLWVALFCGLFVDLYSDLPFGINALVYALATLLLYWQRRNFFPDKTMTLAVMTLFFAWLTTAGLWIVNYLLGRFPIISWQMVVSDFAFMPFLDALYAFMLFTVPMRLFSKRRRRGSDYFLN